MALDWVLGGGSSSSDVVRARVEPNAQRPGFVAPPCRPRGTQLPCSGEPSARVGQGSPGTETVPNSMGLLVVFEDTYVIAHVPRRGRDGRPWKAGHVV